MTPPPNGVASQAVRRTVPVARRPRVDSLWSESWRRFRKHRLATVGMVVLLVMVVAVLGGAFVYKVPINEIDFKAKLKAPSWAHPLGTHDLRQDLLARMLYGGRLSPAVGVAPMLLALIAGTLIRAAR